MCEICLVWLISVLHYGEARAGELPGDLSRVEELCETLGFQTFRDFYLQLTWKKMLVSIFYLFYSSSHKQNHQSYLSETWYYFIIVLKWWSSIPIFLRFLSRFFVRDLVSNLFSPIKSMYLDSTCHSIWGPPLGALEKHRCGWHSAVWFSNTGVKSHINLHLMNAFMFALSY